MSFRRQSDVAVASPRSRLDHVLDISFLNFGPSTGPKVGKDKKTNPVFYAKTDPPTFLKEFDEDAFDPPKHNGEPVKTVRLNNKKSTEIETKWLRQNYGEHWSEAPKDLKTKIKNQARHVLSFEIAKIVTSAQDEASAKATAEFNEQINIKLDWKLEVFPELQKRWPPDWRQSADGKWLSLSEKNVRADEIKKLLRASKLADLEEQRRLYVAKEVAARIDQLLDEVNFPDVALKRKARALLRHWFNRNGLPDAYGNTNRIWNKPGLDADDESSTKKAKKNVSIDVTPTMHKARLAWAKLVVGSDYNPANPPQPPSTLYTALDIRPLPDQYLLDEIEEVSDEGGQWLWLYMRKLELAADSTKDYYTKLIPVDFSMQFWDPSFRQKQMESLIDSYGEFIQSVDDMSAIPGAKNVAFSYTVGSGRFNKYLLWPSNAVGGDPRNIPTEGSGAGGVAGNSGYGQIGPPDELHRLYKLINRCPRLPAPAVFVRAGNSWRDLPHNLGKAAPIAPVIGTGYLNVTFMSTSSASPDEFTSGILSAFYNHNGDDDGCCMFAVTCPKNSPVLPLVLGGESMSNYATEQEVVLPPGLVFVYQGEKRLKVGDKTPMIRFYQAELS